MYLERDLPVSVHRTLISIAPRSKTEGRRLRVRDDVL